MVDRFLGAFARSLVTTFLVFLTRFLESVIDFTFELTFLGFDALTPGVVALFLTEEELDFFTVFLADETFLLDFAVLGLPFATVFFFIFGVAEFLGLAVLTLGLVLLLAATFFFVEAVDLALALVFEEGFDDDPFLFDDRTDFF
ncbi:MAG: hypothetical protein ACPGYT_00505 [Nitrospirales bacterium]